MMRIKELRQERNLSLRDLSSALNIAYSSIGKYERGEQQPSFETLIKIANYFNVTIDYLLGTTNSKKPDNRVISDELNLSDDAIDILKDLRLTISKTTGISLSDILNAMIINPKFEKLLKRILLYITREPSDWDNLQSFLSEQVSPEINIDDAKEISYAAITKDFNSLLNDILDNDIKTFNLIEKTSEGIRISSRKL